MNRVARLLLTDELFDTRGKHLVNKLRDCMEGKCLKTHICIHMGELWCPEDEFHSWYMIWPSVSLFCGLCINRNQCYYSFFLVNCYCLFVGEVSVYCLLLTCYVITVLYDSDNKNILILYFYELEQKPR